MIPMTSRRIVIVAATVWLSVIHGLCHELYFGLMTGEHGIEEAKNGIEVALRSINQRSNILPGYTLKYTDSHVECNRTLALNELFAKLFYSSQELVALIDSGCSITTEATAEISHYFNITQISCASSSEELSDRVRFPYYFQLLPSEVNLARVFYSIIKEYGWRRVALIVQNEHRFKSVARSLKSMKAKDLRVTYAEMVIESEYDSRMSMFDSESRIFVVITDSKHARWVICEAYKLGMKYPKHLFLTFGSYESQWWTREDRFTEKLNCTARDRAEVLQFSFAASHHPSLPGDVRYSYVVSKHREAYINCYDATFVLALALNKTIAERQPVGSGLLSSSCNDYHDNTIIELMKMHLEGTNFTGLSGQVHFDENGVRETVGSTLLQYRTTYVNGTPVNSFSTLDQKLRMVVVAHTEAGGNELVFLDEDYSVWPGYIPHDGLPNTAPSTVILPVAVVVILLNTGGLVFALVCLLFNILHRNKMLIRLNSPKLNYLIVAGAIFIYCSAISFAVPTTSSHLVIMFCFFRMWLLTYGYFCGFGAITAKLWRIYRIFRNPQEKKKRIHDWHLMLFVFILLFISMIVMILHILLEGFVSNFNVAEIPNSEISYTVDGELEIRTNYFFYRCSSHPWIRYFMQAMIFSCMCILQVVALYLAFRTRKVKVKGLNDAKYASTVVYITTFIMFITLIITFTLTNYITAYATIYGVGLWISCTILLAIVFVPKMLGVLKDPQGETVFTAHEEALQVISALGELPDSEFVRLRKKVQEMESAIVAYKRLTGLDLMNNHTLVTSVSMINLHASDRN